MWLVVDGYIQVLGKLEKGHNLLLIVTFFFFAACSNESLEVAPSDIGTSFYPSNVGSYWVYDVVKIDYVFSGDNDTLRYQLKEVVKDTFVNLHGSESKFLYRYTKGLDQDDWELDSIWTLQVNNSQVIITENNVPFLKMVFPIKEGAQWDGNSFNVNEPDLYVMKNVYQPYKWQDSVYNSSLSIVQSDEFDEITGKDIRKEVYINDIGLVYKESTVLSYCSDTECLGQQKIESGSYLEQKLIEYGKEKL